jgi:hypothetical protein
MKDSRFVCRNVGSSWLALAVLVNVALAGTDKCTEVPKCTRADLCGRVASAPCVIRVSEKGGVATVAAQPQLPGGDVCVSPNTEIRWLTLEKKSSFIVKFQKSPFVSSSGSPVTFQGDDLHAPQGDKVIPVPKDACYQYSVTHSIDGSHATLDPKVIVTNVRDDDSGQTEKEPENK